MLRYLCCCFTRQENDYEKIKIQKIEEELKFIEYKDAVKFVFPIEYGKVIKVYDGDTITICSKLPYDDSPIYRFQVRLNGIDTPEIKGHTDAERKLAIEARDALIALIMGKVVSLKNVGTEKYGRILADVYYKNTHVNNWMIQHNHAVKYDGGTKVRPKDWDE